MSSELKPYARYKDSGVEWLGEVPEHWAVRPLSVLFSERNEKVTDRDYAPLSVTKAGVVPQLDHVAKTQDNDNRKRVVAGDYVINSRSDRKGSSGLSRLEGSTSVINIVLVPSKEMDGGYCHRLLRSFPFQEEFYRNGKGIVADLWSTRFTDMKAIWLPLPPLPEQHAIADYLDSETGRIDALISEQRELIELLKEKRQALISHCVTGGLDPDVPTKDSGVEWLGEVPEHWDVVKLKRIASIRYGIGEPPVMLTRAHLSFEQLTFGTDESIRIASFMSTWPTSLTVELSACKKVISSSSEAELILEIQASCPRNSKEQSRASI